MDLGLAYQWVGTTDTKYQSIVTPATVYPLTPNATVVEHKNQPKEKTPGAVSYYPEADQLRIDVGIWDKTIPVQLEKDEAFIVDEFGFRTSGFFDTGQPFEYDLNLPASVQLLGKTIFDKVLFTQKYAFIRALSPIIANTLAYWTPRVSIYCTASKSSGTWLDIQRRCTVIRSRGQVTQNPNTYQCPMGELQEALTSLGAQEGLLDESQEATTPTRPLGTIAESDPDSSDEDGFAVV